MELSTFNSYLEDFPRVGYTTIYNTYSKKIICVRKDLVQHPSSSISEKMFSFGMLVSSQKDEISSVVKKFEKNEFNSDVLKIVLILTRKCNCNCVYCYENQQNVSFDDVSDFKRILAFIDNTMLERGLKKLRILFYGGEPLLKAEIITKISQFYYEKLGTAFRFSIITNGTLLSEALLSHWNKTGLELIKVTIDGNETSHNKRRPLTSGAGTYQTIINNLTFAKNYAHIVLNIVVDENLDGVSDLIDDLLSRQISPEYALSLREPCLWSDEIKSQLVLSYVKLLHDKGAYQSTKIAIEHGTICMGKDRNYFVVDGGGYIYQCNANLKSVIGCIDKPVTKDYTFKLSDTCRCCKYLPICYGDCLFEDKCEKHYFDITVPELLKIYTKKV